ncbi:DUF4922 domain-containing protein [Barnesiella sp. An55]|uniref:DUF4922 domain-containing protein n=1 Tax=Barnesiella sp. An55 TaxID=1965646 RepID=UPI000B39A8FB|nr:DUF4922 domain-containing protein [Barnesiella sp. An55]OUN72495.1 DUF4922 domain-containing protein [Barnesiella sp. An55]HIZ25635.1 DUF4922 domain-containing protein [Candidatus Barnesiella merdipullorum]
MEITSKHIARLLDDQLAVWESARNNYQALKSVRVKEITLGGCTVKVQFNPARIVSSAAKVDSQSLKERKCFLCAENRPEVQVGLPDGNYTWLINPFPIFPRHLTIPVNTHTPQLIGCRFGDMLRLAREADDFVLFYNGPKCGASAPDHAHFQAGNKGFLPLGEVVKSCRRIPVSTQGSAHLSLVEEYICPFFLIEAREADDARALFETLYQALEVKPGETEPMMNVLAWYETDRWTVAIFPRALHRPSCYFAEGEKNILLSPASVDMGGVFITPLEKDFEKIEASHLEQILAEVCLDTKSMHAIIEKLK